MFRNKGYVGNSRSVRSQYSIENFEVPLNLINRSLIDRLLWNLSQETDCEYSSISKEDIELLKKQSVKLWKKAADMCGASIWHHTGSYYNETDHYDLYSIADYILENLDKIKEAIEIEKKRKQKENPEIIFVFAKVEVWGGTRRRPKLEGYDEVAGIKKGDWIHFKEDHEKNNKIKKYKLSANKTVYYKEFNSYDELIKHHKEFKNTKRVFNALVKELYK